MRPLLILTASRRRLGSSPRRRPLNLRRRCASRIFARRCLHVPSATARARNGLSLETFAGVMKGGASGDAAQPGRPAASLLYQARGAGEGRHREDAAGAGRKFRRRNSPSSAIGFSRACWRTRTVSPKGRWCQSLDFKPSSLNKPARARDAAANWRRSASPEPARPHPVTALAASPWAPLLAVAGHERIYLYDLGRASRVGELPFPEGVPYVLRFSRDGAMLLAGGGRGVQSGKVVLFDVKTGKRRAVGAGDGHRARGRRQRRRQTGGARRSRRRS